MNVLILSLVFPPDSVSTAEIMGDLARDLHASGHAVTVLTTTPHYNRDAEAERRQPMAPFWGSLLKRSDYDGIAVYHAAMPAKTPSVVRRLLAWAGFHVLTTIAGVISVPKPDVILAPSPPLSIGVSAWIVGALRRAPFVYNVQEIYPDIAVNLGAIRSARAVRALLALERFVYRRAAAVTVIAPRMRQRLIEKGVPPDKVHVIPNFVDLGRVTAAPRDNEFARTHGLVSRLSVTYAGNIGPAQGLEIVVEAARILADAEGVRFVIIGDGISRERLAQAAAALPSQNVIVLPYHPNSMMPLIYGASDVCLVPQARATGSDAIPSKVYRIMAAGKPIVAVAEPESDLAALVRTAGCGAVVAPGDAQHLAAVVQDVHQHRPEWSAMGDRGRAHVAEHYARPVVSSRYAELIGAMAAGTITRR